MHGQNKQTNIDIIKLTDFMKSEILKNNNLSLDLAKLRNIRQDAVFKLVHRDSELLLLPTFVEVYKKYGYTEEQIISK